jgi:alpha-glucosidase (family GH31 glycosyl hydrolase)
MSGWSLWGSDIGGYQESNPSATPADLFRRWTQFGALSPIMQMHRQVGGGHPYPWSYGADALDNYRTWARLHTALFPYLYSYVHLAAETGVPVLRPPVFVHPEDPALATLDHTFFVGDWLLAAPVLANEATTRTVQLPAGTWFDWFTGEGFEGGAAIEWTSTDLHRMPLFVKAGAIVPMIAEATMTLVEVPHALEVRVWPAETPSRFAMWDGTQLGAGSTPAKITVTIDGHARSIALRVRSPEPLAVRRDGDALPWTRDGDVTVIEFEHTGGAAAIELVYDDAPSAPDAGVGGDDDDDGGAATPSGCGCGASPDASGLSLLLVLAAAASGRRGRGRTSPRRSAPRAAARTDRDGRAARASSGCPARRRSPGAA